MQLKKLLSQLRLMIEKIHQNQIDGIDLENGFEIEYNGRLEKNR